MPNRTRNKVGYTNVGVASRYGSSSDPNATFQSAVSTCVDGVFPGDGGGLEVTHILRSGSRINGHSGGSRWYQNYHSLYLRGQPAPAHASTGSPSDSAAASMAFARTNPSRPVVDAGVTIGELRELPKLIQDLGRLSPYAIKDAAEAYAKRSPSAVSGAGNATLLWQFGIMPLARDLENLLGLHDHIAKREKELTKLSSGGLNRLQTIGQYSSTPVVQTNVAVDSVYGLVYVPSVTTVTTERVWAHARWVPQNPSSLANHDLGKLARKAVLGLTIDASTAWNLMPWSWLVDWVGSTGDYLSGMRNIVPARLTRMLIMRHTRTIKSISGSTDGWLSVSPGEILRETKYRAPTSPSPFEARLPFLSAGQLSVVGALAAVKSFGR